MRMRNHKYWNDHVYRTCYHVMMVMLVYLKILAAHRQNILFRYPDGVRENSRLNSLPYFVTVEENMPEKLHSTKSNVLD